MLAEDPVTGQLYEVPDGHMYEAEYGENPYYAMGEAPMVYDGLGNPVGLPFLAPLIAKAAPMVSSLIPQVGRMVSNLIPQAGNHVRGLVPSSPQALPSPVAQPGALPFRFPFARPQPIFRAPPPVGWVTPALPFTGARPRRLYMRCSVWPGPAGMVPGFANQPQPGVITGALPTGLPAAQAVRRRRRRR